MKKRRRRENRGDGEYRGEQCAQHRVKAAGVDVARLHAFVHNRALLEEKHPGRYCRADVGQDQHQNFVAVSVRQRRPGDQRMADRMPIRTRQNRGGNK